MLRIYKSLFLLFAIVELAKSSAVASEISKTSLCLSGLHSLHFSYSIEEVRTLNRKKAFNSLQDFSDQYGISVGPEEPSGKEIFASSHDSKSNLVSLAARIEGIDPWLERHQEGSLLIGYSVTGEKKIKLLLEEIEATAREWKEIEEKVASASLRDTLLCVGTALGCVGITSLGVYAAIGTGNPEGLAGSIALIPGYFAFDFGVNETLPVIFNQSDDLVRFVERAKSIATDLSDPNDWTYLGTQSLNFEKTIGKLVQAGGFESPELELNSNLQYKTLPWIIKIPLQMIRERKGVTKHFLQPVYFDALVYRDRVSLEPTLTIFLRTNSEKPIKKTPRKKKKSLLEQARELIPGRDLQPI